MNNRFIRRASTVACAVTALALNLNLSASAQGDASSSSSSTTSSASGSGSSSSSNSSSSSAATASDSSASAGVLWTAPQYQVKSVGKKPAASTMPPDIAPNQGSAANAAALGNTASTPIDDGNATVSNSSSASPRRKRRRADSSQVVSPAYDESAAKAFSQAVSSEPQYVWLSPDRPSPASQSKFQQNRVLASSEQLNRLDSYIKDLSQSIQTNLSVPGSAQLVETANRKYSYLISFVVKNSGQITNISSEKQVGTLSSVPLADDDENGQVVKAISRALGKVSPVKVPPAGFAPWYMLLKYDVNSGNVMVACLNAK